MRSVDERLSEVIALTHPNLVPQEGDYINEVHEKILFVIEDLQRQLKEMKATKNGT